jgi:chaperone required for assembly of F1-ATPase
MSPDAMKDSTGRRIARFYEAVTAATVEGGFTVLLDGQALKTPAKNLFRLPTEALAQAVVEEWLAQDENVDWAQMPLTRLAFSAIDRIPQFRDLTIEEIIKYSQTDLVCYPVELPVELARRQTAAWRPLLIWLRGRFGVELAVASNVARVDQPVELETVLRTGGGLRRLSDRRDLPNRALGERRRIRRPPCRAPGGYRGGDTVPRAPGRLIAGARFFRREFISSLLCPG